MLRSRFLFGPSDFPWAPSAEPPALVRERLPVEVARLFFPLAGLNRPYFEEFYFARPPNVGWWTDWAEHADGGYRLDTNSLGIREVVLAGGTAQLGGLAGAIQQLIGVTVRVGDPLAAVEVGKKARGADNPALAVPIGLGMAVD